ncbi:DUF1642 domain-containing protein [Enterococcus gilvus]|uniref:DUF1642 domain-containing protein n=1 Tax=Enterococcus gilvus TaxID=160453 RepID=UPI003ED95E68
MNKQEKEELITFVNRAKEDLKFSFSAYPKTCPGYVQGNKLINYIEHLYEQQKVKVPEEFDEWYQQIEQRWGESATDFALWKICQYGFGNGFEDVNNDRTSSALSDWVCWNKEVAINAVWNGYEVEEEPKYYLDLPKMGMVNEISNSQLCWTNCDGGITEKEIKTIDERYWPFAVPVEKV